MDKVKKALRKLRKKELDAFLLIMRQLKQDYRRIPGVQPLTGIKKYYRIRVGQYRIIFEVKSGKVEIRRITKRDEQTYKNL